MTNEQLYVAIGIPATINAVLIGVLMAYLNAKFPGHPSTLRRHTGPLARRTPAGGTRLKHLEEKFK